jgi:hypothetical protein
MRQSRPRAVGCAGPKAALAVAYGATAPHAAGIDLGTLGTRPCDLEHRLRKLPSQARPVVCGEDAGPWGDWRARALTTKGPRCWVVAPARRPKPAADRVPVPRRPPAAGSPGDGAGAPTGSVPPRHHRSSAQQTSGRAMNRPPAGRVWRTHGRTTGTPGAGRPGSRRCQPCGASRGLSRSPAWPNAGRSPAARLPDTCCPIWACSLPHMPAGSDAGRGRLRKRATRLPDAPWATGRGRLASRRRSVATDNGGLKHHPKSSRTSAGKPRCGCVHATNDGSPAGNMPTKSSSPSPVSWWGACGPWPNRSP